MSSLSQIAVVDTLLNICLVRTPHASGFAISTHNILTDGLAACRGIKGSHCTGNSGVTHGLGSWRIMVGHQILTSEDPNGFWARVGRSRPSEYALLEVTALWTARLRSFVPFPCSCLFAQNVCNKHDTNIHLRRLLGWGGHQLN